MMRKWVPLLLIVAAVAVTIFYYPQLPDRIATHWSVSGEADGWMSRLWGAWLMPLFMAVMLVFLKAVPHIDPRGANYAKFAGMYEWLIVMILAFMLLTHLLVLMVATGTRVRIDRIIMSSVGVMIAIIGLMLPRAHPNWFVGIRTPWTLTSDVAWERTHKVGGPLMTALGVLMIALTFVAPEVSIWILVAGAIGIVAFLFAYSYQVWKQDPLKR